MKCIISGCKIPARGKLKVHFIQAEFYVCGIHRKDLAVTINQHSDRIHKAHGKVISSFIEALRRNG